MRIGLVGFGVGGRYFHSPFIDAAEGVELAGVVARSAQTTSALEASFPGVPAYASLEEMVDTERAGAGLDAVTITTPPHTRHDLVLQALDLGLHVVADKPFAPSANDAEDLARAAEKAERTLAVFHNRRWDSDIVTLKGLLDTGRLTGVTRFHSRMDQADASTMEGGPTGGLLRDLGSHVVDQALWLFGPAESVYATLDLVDTPQGRTDAAFVISLRHRSGVTSHLEASKLNELDERELRVYGEGASYLARTTDVQAQDSLAGRFPAQDRAHWGFEPESAWGTLHTTDGAERIPAEQGDYTRFYEAFEESIRTGTPPPVTTDQAIAVLRVLDAARASAESGSTVTPG